MSVAEFLRRGKSVLLGGGSESGINAPPDVHTDARSPAALAAYCRLPQHFYVDIGNYCNLRCPFCVTGAGETLAPRGFMKLNEFKTIFSKIGDHAKLISLYNWGEPFLNPDLLEIIEVAASRSARVHIDSNLSTRDFSDEYSEQIVKSGLHSLFGSIDGATQDSYAKYRVRGNLSRVIDNLRSLVAATIRLGSPYPILGWQFHVHAYNEHEVEAARDMAYDLGIGIVFKRLNSPDPSWRSSAHDSGFMILRGEKWFNQTYMPPANPDFDSSILHPAVVSPCSQLFATMTIASNGDVMPCTCVEGPDYSMGNLLESTLPKIWNGPAFRQSREFILNYGPEQGGCSVCERLNCPVSQKFVPSVVGDRP
jgi:radical SAM protein with 4Fe4S-binding SPASM domain